MWGIWNGFVSLLETVLLTFSQWTGNAGLGIILFTIVARVIILPLTITSLRSSRRMQEVQPLMKELQRKYGKDPQRLNQETMKLYRDYKINPAGGCLPLLLQFPIFIGVYQAVINLTRVVVPEYAAVKMIDVMGTAGVNVAGLAESLQTNRLSGGFLWLQDLGVPDPWYILPVLSVVFQLIVQLMATPRVQDPQQKAMFQSMLFLPIIFGYIGFTFPSGAVLYWVVGSILSILQQYVVSGWGSLANYLKFLPADFNGLMPPLTPAAAVAAAGASGGATATTPASEEEEPSKVSFWDVMRPLTDAESTTATSEEAADEQTDQEIARVRRAMSSSNPRRRKARR